MGGGGQGGSGRGGYIIIIKVFIKHKILSIETHARTHNARINARTHAPVHPPARTHTSILTMQSLIYTTYNGKQTET